MNGKQWAHTFHLKAQSPEFGKAYAAELSRLKLAYRIAELREKSGLTQAEPARKWA